MGFAWVFIVTGILAICLFVTGMINFARDHGAPHLMDKARYRMIYGVAGIFTSMFLFFIFLGLNN